MEFDMEIWVRGAAFVGAAISMGLGAIGAAIGVGYTAAQATFARSRSKEISRDIFRTMLVGQAIAESAAIFSLVIAILLIFSDVSGYNLLNAAALGGAGLCMGFGAVGSGVGAGFPTGEACLGLSRQPAISGRITTNMLIGTAVCQTPAIFAMVVALMLIFLDSGSRPVSPTWAAFLGAGFSIGLAAIGSGYGGGKAAGASCEGVARQAQAGGNVTTVMLIGKAVSQTPSVFGMLVGFILMMKPFPESAEMQTSMALLAAGICMGCGGIGPGIGNGLVAEGAVRWVARNVRYSGELMRTMLVGQAISQSTAIYAMVVSLVLIFFI